MTERAFSPAASLILVREQAGLPLEVLMIQRAATMAFAAGAWVFPGGRVDPGDVALARRLLVPDGDAEDAAARIAAIRETIEEAGIAIGIVPPPDRETLATLRAALHAGEDFADLLDRFGLTLDPAALHAFSRWQPHEAVPRRFDTRFYLVCAPAEAEIRADGTETTAACWTGAEAMLARPDALVLFPTACNLRRLAAWSSFAEAAADAARHGHATIASQVVDVAGERFVSIPAGHGYPETRHALATLFSG